MPASAPTATRSAPGRGPAGGSRSTRLVSRSRCSSSTPRSRRISMRALALRSHTAPPTVDHAAELAPVDRHPVGCYVASLGSPASRATATHALENLARILTGGTHDASALPWHELRRQHVAAVRALLAQHRYRRGEAEEKAYSPSSV